MSSSRTPTRRTMLRAGLLGGAALTSPMVLSHQVAEAAAKTDQARTYDFNQNWLFGGVYVTGSELPGYDDSGFTKVAIPHTVVPLSWGNWDYTTWENVWIYRKHLDGADVRGGRVFVDFDGVMTNATVVLNGTTVSTHEGGYLPWSTELTSGLADGDNLLAVIVNSQWLDVPPDNPPGGTGSIDYLQPGGIYRDATLRVVPQIFISDVFAKPQDVLTSDRSVAVQVTVDAAAVPASGKVRVVSELLDGTRRLATATSTATITAVGTSTVDLTIASIQDIAYWSPETPQLYTVSTTITADDISHNVTTRIGFREAVFQTGGFYLNGEPYKIFGLDRHQLFPYTGMAAPARLQRRDAEILRNELNCNMVRCSHYPQSPHFLDACDELGLMFWEEPPGWGYVGDTAFQDIVVANVTDMVIRDRNRPSLILWAPRLNETSNYVDLYAQTRQICYDLDGSRQTSGAMDSYSLTGWAEDVFGYDDYQTSDGNATLAKPLPGVPYLVSEAVGALDGSPTYRWIDTSATLAEQGRMHAQVHDIAQSATGGYAGLIGWCGIDYASIDGGDRIWDNMKTPGVTDTFRVPKPGAAFYQSQVSPDTAGPVLLPMFFWDFGSSSPATGPGADSIIATNCDEVRLYLNDEFFVSGTPDTADYGNLAYPLVFVDLTVDDGSSLRELRIDGYIGGRLVKTVRMSSDPARDHLGLTVEDTSIVADGSDATRIAFRALDAYGNQRPYPAGDVTLARTGPAELIGDNPFEFATYGGVGGAFVRSVPAKTGVVRVTADHPTLGQASIRVTVTRAAAGQYL